MGRTLSLRAACALAAFVVAFTIAPRVHADVALPEGVELSWQAPDGCPQTDAARAELARLLAPAPGDDWPEVEVQARVEAEASGGYRLALRFEGDREGSRELHAADCGELARAAAVLINLVLARTPEPAPEAEAEPEPAAEPEADGAGAALGVAVGPSLVLDVGSLPRLVAGVGGAVHVELGAIELGLDVAWFSGTRDTLAAAGAEVELALWQLGVSACAPLTAAPLRVAPCGGLELLGMSGQSQGVADPRSDSRVVLAFDLGGALTWVVAAPVALRLELAALVPLGRARWRVRDPDYTHRPSALAGQLALGVRVSP